MSSITLQKFSNYIFNNKFAQFNFITEIVSSNTDSALKESFSIDFEITEIYTIKLISERMLYKYCNVLKDLVDCKNINAKICLDSLNGFLIVENDELILYSIYRFTARDGSHNIYEGKSIWLIFRYIK
jgi:hypothetical protein